jgi:predicted TIM-barrel fold metal-dependent hydrolase
MFMVNPLATGATERVRRAFSEHRLSCACLFPAMHHYSLDDKSVNDIFELAAYYDCATFVHCGALSIGVRKKIGLRSTFDIQRGNPLALIPVASRFPTVPIIVPHFGAGFFRELLMASDLCPNIYTDTSSSNSWIKLTPTLSLVDVFRSTLDVLGPERILFGTDSSFFPRGWQQPLFDIQQKVFDALGLIPSHRDAILSDNFNRIFR